ncbi:SMI1/KNR4 family protein [Solibacillus sp. CAU 1738]|uniref:SMI1/KNR4 family protein n=1 Tax=Solibacillus sp. CAU 1738 TaxID=3140363 RepID=UPI0032607EF1
MGSYKEILEKIAQASIENRFEKLSKSKVDEDLIFGDIPQDYRDFLIEVGFGSVADGYFMFYEGLIEADEIYDAVVNPEIKKVLLFGDNFSGDATGFLPTENWSIVEIWHEDLSIVTREEETFFEFVRKVFLNDM